MEFLVASSLTAGALGWVLGRTRDHSKSANARTLPSAYPGATAAPAITSSTTSTASGAQLRDGMLVCLLDRSGQCMVVQPTGKAWEVLPTSVLPCSALIEGARGRCAACHANR